MERQIPVDPAVALAELDAIDTSERDAWLDYAAIKPLPLTGIKIAIIALGTLGTAVFITGYFWLTDRLGLLTTTALSAVVLVLVLKVIAPWIDRRQMGVERPIKPPAEIRREVQRLQVIMMAPMMIGVVIGVPFVLRAAEVGDFAMLGVIILVGLSAINIIAIWWNRRIAQRIQAGWRPGDSVIRFDIGRVLIILGLVAVGAVAVGVILGAR